jgi:hypothetical protein
MSRWITLEVERVLYVDRGHDVILCGLAGRCTLVLKLPATDESRLQAMKDRTRLEYDPAVADEMERLGSK